jgi:hypothetical protein
MAATAEAKIEAPALVSKADQIEPNRFIEAQYRRNEYVVNLPADYEYAKLFNPDNWKQIARGSKIINIGDKIEVRKDDMSLWALLLVTESVALHARLVVAELFKKDLEPIKQDETQDDQFEIRHLGLQDGWAVINKSTQRVIRKDMKSRDDARAYINGDLRPQVVGRSR